MEHTTPLAPARRATSTRHGIHARIAFGIAFVDVLEEGGTLPLVKRFVVGAGEAGIQHVLNGELELRPGGRLLPPIQDQESFTVWLDGLTAE